MKNKLLILSNIFMFCISSSLMIWVLYSKDQKQVEINRHIKSLEMDRLLYVRYEDLHDRDEYISKNLDALYTLANQLMMNNSINSGYSPTTDEITLNYNKHRYKIKQDF